MNALPLDTTQTPREVIDELVANFGFRRVFLTVLSRMVRRSRPPDLMYKQADISVLDDHLRRDIGLPPCDRRRLEIDLIAINREFYR